MTAPDGTPRRCCSNRLGKHDTGIHNALDGIWVDIPTPFKTGDIVYGSNPNQFGANAFHREPFVLTGICYWDLDEQRLESKRSAADFSDMTAFGYWVYESGEVYDECMHAYQDLEYYRGELTGDKRILIALSNFEKGEIGPNLLMRAYEIMRNRKHYEDSREVMWFTKEGQMLAGLIDKDEAQ